MEKAAAKFFGRYENMNGGQASESLYALTGMPTYTQKLSKATSDEIWARVNEYDSKGYIMTTSTASGKSLDGLIDGHAYSLIGSG